MIRKVKLATRRSILLAVTASMILTFYSGYYWPFQERYYPLNNAWDGCSEIISRAMNSTIIWSYDPPLESNGTLLAIIGPGIEFSQSESSQIRLFLQNGGTVLLADDTGSGNTLLQALNMTERFSPMAIADLYFYSKNPNFPLITEFNPSPITRNLTTLITERPSYIENSTSARILATSSPFSFIDVNGNGTSSVNETLRPFPIIAEIGLGKGLLILVADPDIFTNQLITMYDNMQLFLNILRVAGGHLLYDAHHLESAPLVAWRAALRRLVSSLASQASFSIQAILVATVIIGALAVRVVKLRKKHVAL